MSAQYLCFRTLVNPAAAGAFELHVTLAIPPPVRNSFDKLMDLVDRFRIACSKHQQVHHAPTTSYKHTSNLLVTVFLAPHPAPQYSVL